MSYVFAYVTAALVMGGLDYLWLSNTSGPIYHRALGGDLVLVRRAVNRAFRAISSEQQELTPSLMGAAGVRMCSFLHISGGISKCSEQF